VSAALTSKAKLPVFMLNIQSSSVSETYQNIHPKMKTNDKKETLTLTDSWQVTKS